MAKTESPDRLSESEAARFRRLFRDLMQIKGVKFAEVTDYLGWDDEQQVRNALKVGIHVGGRARPLLAPTALAIGRAVCELPWHRARRPDVEGRILTYWHHPPPQWLTRYRLRQAGPGVHIPRSELDHFAAALAAEVTKSPASRRVTQEKICDYLRRESVTMAKTWREVASNYAGVVAASAARGQVIWRDAVGQDIVRAERGRWGNHDVQIVGETLHLLLDLMNDGQTSWQHVLPKSEPKPKVKRRRHA